MAKLKLGKGTLFVKSRMKRLPRQDDVWEADFHALPKPMEQTERHYLGLVVSTDGVLQSHLPAPYTPDVNDLARLLAEAIRRPPVGGAHRPSLLYLRGNPRWEELFPHMKEIGIEVSIRNELPAVEDCFREILRGMNVTPTPPIIQLARNQTDPAREFPAINQWAREWGWIEIGQQELFGFVARALNEGGTKVDVNRFMTLTEAMIELERGLRAWFEEQEVEVNEAEG